MILHQNHHLKVAVVKETPSKPNWRMSCAQKMSHDFKATNTFCCKQLHIAPLCVEIPDLQAVTSTILCALREQNYPYYRDVKSHCFLFDLGPGRWLSG